MLISSLFLSKTHWCFSIRRLSLVTSCTIINRQFYTGHSCNFLRVENETMAKKRPYPSREFYKCIREFPAISRKRICERKPELLGTFEAERIVAKKFVKGKPRYMSIKQRLYLTLNLLIAKLLISPKKINLSNNK